MRARCSRGEIRADAGVDQQSSLPYVAAVAVAGRSLLAMGELPVDSVGLGESDGLRPWAITPLAGTSVAHTSPKPLDGSATPEGTLADPPTLTTPPYGMGKERR